VETATATLPESTRTLLRRAVLDHALSEARRRYPPVLHVGVPGRLVAAYEPAAETADGGLRTDVVAALRARAGADPEHLVWLTRSGSLELQDVDVAWLSATLAAYAEAAASPPVFAVVNRRGWRDPRTGAGRTWARVRP